MQIIFEFFKNLLYFECFPNFPFMDDIIEYDIYGDPIYPYTDDTNEEKVFDAFGNELTIGDSVQLTKELKVKGTKVTLKK